MVISLKSWRPSGRVHGCWGWMHTALVTSLFQWTAAQLSITPDVVTAAVGDTVTLSLRHEGRLVYLTWYRGEGTDADHNILALFGSDLPVYGPKSTGRETALPDGSLRITEVQAGDTGTYTVRVSVDPGGLQEAMARLRVHALVTSLFQWTAAQLSITPDVVTAAVGDNVTLSLRREGRLVYLNWFRGEGTDARNQILGVFGSHPPLYGPESTGREALLPDGSLRITDVQAGDTGTYTVEVSVDPGGLQQAKAQLRVHEAPPAADAPCTSWWVTLAVASGMLLGAALVVLGVVLFYERRAKKAKGVTPGGSPGVISEPAVNYENVENGNRALTAARSPDADPTYMALQHGDQATYGQLKRPQK